MTQKLGQLFEICSAFNLATRREVAARVESEYPNLGRLLDDEPQPLPYVVPVDRETDSRGKHDWMAMACQPGIQRCGGVIWYVDATSGLVGLWRTDATTLICALPYDYHAGDHVYRIALKPPGFAKT